MNGERFCRRCRLEVDRLGIDWLGGHLCLDGEQIHYVEGGTGEPLILIHGFMAWSYTWRRNLAVLASRARPLALDLRGFGLSEKSKRQGHSLDDHADLVRRFMDTLGIEKAVLAGHSMGGEVSLRVALRWPERVRGLVLVSSSGYVSREQGWAERWALRAPLIGEAFVRAVAMNRRFAGGALRGAYRLPERVKDTDIDAYLLPARIPGAAGAFVRMLRDADFGRTAADLGKVTHPTLIVWGENDPWIPLAHGERLARELPNSRLVTFQECGHVPPEEYPDRFNQLVLEFLTSLESK